MTRKKVVCYRPNISDTISGKRGITCDETIDFCASNPCFYNQTCDSLPNGYTCSCSSGKSNHEQIRAIELLF